MSHLRITLDNVPVLEGELTILSPNQPPAPPPVLPPPTPSPVPPPGVSGELLPGAPNYLKDGPSAWSISNRSRNFGVSISGGIAPITLTILDPAGNIAQKLPSWGGGPATYTFPAGAGELFVQVSIVGTYIAQVDVVQAGIQSSIELRDEA